MGSSILSILYICVSHFIALSAAIPSIYKKQRYKNFTS